MTWCRDSTRWNRTCATTSARTPPTTKTTATATIASSPAGPSAPAGGLRHNAGDDPRATGQGPVNRTAAGDVEQPRQLLRRQRTGELNPQMEDVRRALALLPVVLGVDRDPLRRPVMAVGQGAHGQGPAG